MNVSEYNRRIFQERWDDLNKTLLQVRQEKGLGAALEILSKQQYDHGFIVDDLRSVIHYQIPDPDDGSFSFCAQYNPRRTLRKSGFGRDAPPPGSRSENDGCFLCLENIRWMQRGVELGLDLTLGDTKYVCYCNPFPLKPVHMTVATRDHVPQAWAGSGNSGTILKIEQVLEHIIALAEELPGYIAFFNGRGAGASISSHFHFQLFKRPHGQKFALECAPTKTMKGIQPILKIKDYPILVVYFSGQREDIVTQAAVFVQRLTDTYEYRDSLSANIIATLDSSDTHILHLYVTPRHSSYSHAPGMNGMVAGLEILGELVLSTDTEKQNLDAGTFEYDTVERILSAVEPPGILACINQMPKSDSAAVSMTPHRDYEQKAVVMAGVLAVGGEGKRWQPMENKHLQALYDKPALFYLVTQHMQAGIHDIMIVCSKRNRRATENMVEKSLLAQCGVTFSFCDTEVANGPAGVFRIPEVREFIKGRAVSLLLDGVYFGGNFPSVVAECGQLTDGCTILAARVSDPRPFGWIRTDEKEIIIDLVEKPRIQPEPGFTYLVQTHMYFYGPDVVERAERILPSQSGEYDMVSLHESYLHDGKLNFVELEDIEEDKWFWDDIGTVTKRLNLENIIRDHQLDTGQLIGSPHLQAYKSQWITKAELKKIALENEKSHYWRAVLESI